MSNSHGGDNPDNSRLALEASLTAFNSGPSYRTYFLAGGLAFLLVGLVLFILAGIMVYRISGLGPIIEVPHSTGPTSSTDILNFFGRILSFFLAPLVSLTAGLVCTLVGTRLLTSSGAVTTQVIAPQDLPILGPAIAAGNEEAITQFIRLSSLSGLTGTFTKVGLTGLPLATIALTILLSLLGLFNSQFFDLAKLTLGAFLGSFVQRTQSDPASRPSVR